MKTRAPHFLQGFGGKRNREVLRRTDWATGKRHLADIGNYIAEVSSPTIAERYINDILDFCQTLSVFPRQGTPRDDIRPGLRVVSFRRRVAIVFNVGEDAVYVLGLYYGGQDYESLLQAGSDDLSQ